MNSTVSSFVDSSAQQRNEAEPDSNEENISSQNINLARYTRRFICSTAIVILRSSDNRLVGLFSHWLLLTSSEIIFKESHNISYSPSDDGQCNSPEDAVMLCSKVLLALKALTALHALLEIATPMIMPFSLLSWCQSSLISPSSQRDRRKCQCCI